MKPKISNALNWKNVFIYFKNDKNIFITKELITNKINKFWLNEINTLKKDLNQNHIIILIILKSWDEKSIWNSKINLLLRWNQ